LCINHGGTPSPVPDKTRWLTEKMSCKTMKQDENDQNYKSLKLGGPVVKLDYVRARHEHNSRFRLNA
jgi:hypothetical protein